MSIIKTNKKHFIIKNLIIFSFILMNSIALGMESLDKNQQIENEEIVITNDSQNEMDCNQYFLSFINGLGKN